VLVGCGYNIAEPCNWNDVVCKDYTQPDVSTVNVTSASDGHGGGGGLERDQRVASCGYDYSVTGD
jgi:hypothetical protein